MLHAIYVHAVQKEQRPPLAVLGRIVGQTHQEALHVARLQVAAERALERVVAEALRAIPVPSVDVGRAQLDKVADLGRTAQTNQIGEDRPHRSPLVAVGRRGRQSGIVCARGD